LNIVCATQLLKDFTFGCQVLNTLQRQHNPQGRFTSEEELMKYCWDSVRNYSRRDGRWYAYMGNCIDFRSNAYFVQRMEMLGSTIVG
jgi:hypothetical protein